MFTKCVPDHIYSVFHIQRGCFVIILLITDRLTDVVRNVADIALHRALDRCRDSTAFRMSQHDDHIGVKMRSCILYTSQLMVIQHISGHTDHKEFSDPRGEDCLRYHTGIRTGDHDGVGMLAGIRSLLPELRGDISCTPKTLHVESIPLLHFPDNIGIF